MLIGTTASYIVILTTTDGYKKKDCLGATYKLRKKNEFLTRGTSTFEIGAFNLIYITKVNAINWVDVESSTQQSAPDNEHI